MRKLLLLVLLAVALTLVLTGCGGSKAAGGPTASDALAGLAVLTQDDMPGFTGGGGVGPCDYGWGVAAGAMRTGWPALLAAM